MTDTLLDPPGTHPTEAPPWDDLVVLSHLRWNFVWQRPQHLISRLGAGCPTFFIEEPEADAALDAHGWWIEQCRTGRGAGVRRVVPRVPGEPRWIGFGDPAAAPLIDGVEHLLSERERRVVWLYTAMALPLAERLGAAMVVYDVMDDLTSFRFADPRHRELHLQALERADLVFCGGRSLHAGVATHRDDDHVHCFPSGVETEHYASAVRSRAADGRRERPVAGWVGVVDERLDLGLLAGLADALPHWDVQVVGPVMKIDPASLPQRPNLHYAGSRTYDELPGTMAGFDVALMPFALNEATRSISPTKTLEYLAAGLPVVSTRVPDVVADHSGVVALADDAAGFARACEDALGVVDLHRAEATASLLAEQHWDAIAGRMHDLMCDRLDGGAAPAAVAGPGRTTAR